ncbi:MAG: hypothetical protein KAT62_02260 [Desulfuromonadales bacterium]|nr:hypothetical protein [Chloroflexota bacterium]MCK4621019.1 hypothetical protein [Desulfuromonadales bacterium]
MKKMLVLLAVIAFVATSALVAVADNGPAEIKMSLKKMGVVTFDHAAHQALDACAVCHHTDGYEKCGSCHGVDPNVIKSKDAFHKQCKNCHKEKGGPTKCKGCHIK